MIKPLFQSYVNWMYSPSKKLLNMSALHACSTYIFTLWTLSPSFLFPSETDLGIHAADMATLNTKFNGFQVRFFNHCQNISELQNVKNVYFAHENILDYNQQTL